MPFSEVIASRIEQVLDPQDVVEAVRNRWTQPVLRQLNAQTKVSEKKSFGQLTYAFRIGEIELFISLESFRKVRILKCESRKVNFSGVYVSWDGREAMAESIEALSLQRPGHPAVWNPCESSGQPYAITVEGHRQVGSGEVEVEVLGLEVEINFYVDPGPGLR